MITSLRTPPQFVPTLTTVVELPFATLDRPVDDISPQWTLSPVAELPAVESSYEVASVQMPEADAFRLEEQLLHRILQRVDLSLEQRLGDAVSQAVQQQLEAMVPRLREKIEGLLRTLVVDALAAELSDNTGSVPTRMHQSLG